MKEFKIGDRVKVISPVDGNKRIVGKQGTIRKIDNTLLKPYGIEFDKNINGHSFCGTGKEGHCWWCPKSAVQLVNQVNFKVGDKIIGLKGAPYGVTKEGWIGTIKAVLSDGSIDVTGNGICTSVNVNPKYFALYENPSDKKIVITTDGTTTTAKLYDGKKFVKSAEAKYSPDDKFDFNLGATIALSRLTGLEKKVETSEETFKPGDKVKIIADTNYHGLKIGSIVTLRDKRVSADRDGTTVWFIKNSLMLIRECDIKHVGNPKATLPEEKPKYNGKVVCVNNHNNEGTYTVGKIYQFVDGVMINNNGTEIDNGGHGFTDFEEFARWTSAKFIEVIDEKPKFTRADLKTGMFVLSDKHGWAVIINDKILYKRGSYDYLSSVNNDFHLRWTRIDAVVEAVSFETAELNFKNDKNVLWRRDKK